MADTDKKKLTVPEGLTIKISIEVGKSRRGLRISGGPEVTPGSIAMQVSETIKAELEDIESQKEGWEQ